MAQQKQHFPSSTTSIPAAATASISTSTTLSKVGFWVVIEYALTCVIISLLISHLKPPPTPFLLLIHPFIQLVHSSEQKVCQQKKKKKKSNKRVFEVKVK